MRSRRSDHCICPRCRERSPSGYASDFLPLRIFDPISYRSEFFRGMARSVLSRRLSHHKRITEQDQISYASLSWLSPRLFSLFLLLHSAHLPPRLEVPATSLRGGRGTTRSLTYCRRDQTRPTTYRSAVRLSRETPTREPRARTSHTDTDARLLRAHDQITDVDPRRSESTALRLDLLS